MTLRDNVSPMRNRMIAGIGNARLISRVMATSCVLVQFVFLNFECQEYEGAR